MSSDAPQPRNADLSHLFQDHMPYAGWMVEGAFRFDQHLLLLMQFLVQYCPSRRISRALGAPPCIWSLDMYGTRRMLHPDYCESVIATYAQQQVGLVLNFDNPLPPADSLEDPLGHRLIRSLLQHNPTGRNAVCVASEALAALLRERYPSLPLICHQHRLMLCTGKRTPALYEKLGESYREIILHPRDAVNPAFFSLLPNPWKYIAVANDPVPRTFAVRRELLHLLAELRLRPWDSSLIERKENLADRAGIFSIKDTANLSRCEESALYSAGIRSFLLQSFSFRNELTLLWDLFHHLFRTRPEYANEVALISSAAMAHIREHENGLPSGFNLFTFADN